MAKSSSNPVVADVAPLPGQTALPGTSPAPAPPALSKEDKKKLGDSLLSAIKVRDAAEEALAVARRKCAEAGAAIVAAFGHKGPFTIGGRLFSASKSKGVDGAEGAGFNMREVSGAKEDLG